MALQALSSLSFLSFLPGARQVGQDVPQEDPSRRDPEDPGGLHELAIPEGQGLGPGQTRVEDPPGHREGHDQVPEAGLGHQREDREKEDAHRGKKRRKAARGLPTRRIRRALRTRPRCVGYD